MGLGRWEMKGKDEKEKHKKEVVFHSSQKRMCSETWNTVSCTFHCHFSFSFPSPFLLPHPQLAHLPSSASSALFLICTKPPTSLWTSYLILSFNPIFSFILCFSALTLGSSSWTCHYNLPFTSLCFQTLQITTPKAAHPASVDMTGPLRAASGAPKSRPPPLWSIMAAVWIFPYVFTETNGTTELVHLHGRWLFWLH